MSSIAPDPTATDGPQRFDPGLVVYLAALAAAPTPGAGAEPELPLAAATTGGTADALTAAATAERLVLIGPPGSGKTRLLRRLVGRFAAEALQGNGRMPVYLDLARARPGEGVEEMVARSLAAGAVAGHSLSSLAPVCLCLDNLDRATDVYLLEGLELLMRAGGHAGPAVLVACREADWPAYRSWFEGIPTLDLQPLSGDAIAAALRQGCPPETAAAAERWLARDPALAAAVRSPLALSAFLATVRNAAPETWRRGRVLDALLECCLAGLPQAERPAFRAALTDVALGGIGGGALIEVDTVAMGLGVTRDDMIRSGAVIARGPALEFVEPLLARHCAATALLTRTSGDPRQLALRLADLPEARRAELVVAVYSLAPDPVAFLGDVLAWDDGAALAARCLVEPMGVDGVGADDPVEPSSLAVAVGPGGADDLDGTDGDAPTDGLVGTVGGTVADNSAATDTSAAGVEALCSRLPELGAATLYRLGEELARLGKDQATAIAVRAALERMGESADLDTLFNRPDVDPAPPIAGWVRRYLWERNRGLALRGARDPEGSAAALTRADEALRLLAADLAFEHGLVAAAEGQSADACEAFARAVDADPDRARYLYHYGRTLVSLDRAADAVVHLQRARDLAPGQAEIEAALGEAYHAHDWIEEALMSFEAARALAPSTPAYAQAAGELYAELGELDAAAAAMGEAVATDAAEAGWHDALGQVLAERGRWRAAVRAFARANALAPDSAGYLRHLGRARLGIGETEAAIGDLQQAAQLAPEAAGVLADLGLALAIAGRTTDAIEVLGRAVAQEDAWPADHVWLARMHCESGVLDQALAHARSAVALAPASAAAQAVLGQVHHARGEYRDAAAAFNQAVDRNPTAGEDPVVATAQGALVDGGRPEDGGRKAEAYAASPRVEPQSAFHLDQLARVYEAAGDAPAALEVLTQAVALAPDVVDYRRQAARLCRDLGRLDQAAEHLSRAAMLAGDDAETLHALGTVLQEVGEGERALGILRRAVRLAPENADYWSDLATTSLALGRLNEARGAVDASLERAPDRAGLYALKGEIELAAGEPAVAEAAFRQAVQLDPRSPSYSVQLADLCRSADADAARDLLERVIAVAPDGGASRRLAALHAATGAWDRAADAYAQARVAGPDDPELAAAHGAVLRQAERLDEAIAVLEAAGRAHPESAAVAVQLAQTCQALGRDREALTIYGVAADLDGIEATTLLRWSRLACRMGELDEAVEGARRAAAARPDWAEAQATLADALARRGETEAALDAIRGAAALAPDVPAYRESQAQLARELGRYDEAIAALEEGISDCPAAARLHYGLGSAYSARGWGIEARHAFARAAEIEPGNPTYQRVMAMHMAEDDPRGAIEIMRRAVSAAPDDAETLYQLGLLYARDGDDASAQAQFQRAAWLAPTEPAYQRALGQCLARLGRPDAAEKLRLSMALGPNDAATHAAAGDLFAAEGRFPAALDCYATATRLAPEVPVYWRTLGMLRLTREDAAGAVEALDEAIRLDPADAESHSARGIALEQLGRAGDAAQAFDQAVHLAADDPTGHYRLARARLAVGDEAGALHALDRAVTLRPDHVEALCLLSEIYRSRGAVAEASAFARAATEALPNAPAAWEALAAAERAAGDSAGAVSALQHAAAAEPDNAATWLALAEAADEGGDAETARQAYRHALTLAPEHAAATVRLAELVAAVGWVVPLALPDQPPAIEDADVAELDARLQALRTHRDLVLAVRATRVLAVLRGRAGDATGAVAAAEWAADQDDEPGTLLVVGWARLIAGDATGALESIGLARALGQDGVEAHLLAGRAHVRRHDLELAVEAFTRAVERAPRLPEAHAELAGAEAGLGRHAAALAAYREANSLSGGGWCRDIARQAIAAEAAAEAREALEACAAQAPEDPELQHALAAARGAGGDTAGAIAALEQALARAREQAAWHAELAGLYRAAGAVEKAREQYHKASEIEPATGDYRVADAEIAFELGLTDEASGAVQAALVADPDHAAALAWRGRLALAAGDLPAARQALDRAVAQAPGDPRLRYWLGMTAKAQGDRAAARTHLEAAAQLDQASLDTYLALGEIYASEGAIDDAMQAYQQAVVCDITAVEPHLCLGEACQTAGLPEKAMAHFQRAAELAPEDFRPWQAMGRAHLAAQAPDRAVLAFEAAIRRQPDDAELRYDAGLAYKELRDYGRAAELFRQTMRLSPSNTAAYGQYVSVSAMHFLDRSPAREELVGAAEQAEGSLMVARDEAADHADADEVNRG
jgi:tetratricopeptide (TPR) repeat protein